MLERKTESSLNKNTKGKNVKMESEKWVCGGQFRLMKIDTLALGHSIRLVFCFAIVRRKGLKPRAIPINKNANEVHFSHVENERYSK